MPWPRTSVLIIKLFDRLHNLRTVHALREEKQRRVAQETLDVYAPLAHRLGVQEIKHEFEDRCFAILYPGPNAEIQAKLAERAPERQAFIEKMVDEIAGILADSGIEAEVTRPAEAPVLDLSQDEGAEPTVRGHPRSDRHPDHHRDDAGLLRSARAHPQSLGPGDRALQDYIAMPKINLYQSLHTTVIGPDGKPLEVQIRTAEMHQRAERASPRTGGTRRVRPDSCPGWNSSPGGGGRPRGVPGQPQARPVSGRGVRPDPRWRRQATTRRVLPIDFAYSVHTEVGHRCVGARINGRLVPLSTRLKSGDIIEC